MSRRQTIINQTVYYQEGNEEDGGNTGAVILTLVFWAVAIVTVPIWGLFWLLWQAREVIATCVVAVAKALLYVLPILAVGVALVGMIYAVAANAAAIGLLLVNLGKGVLLLGAIVAALAAVVGSVFWGKRLVAEQRERKPKAQSVPQTVVIVVQSGAEATRAQQLLEAHGVRALLEQPTQWRVIEGTSTPQSAGLHQEVYYNA
jgi:hypothetical protein